MNIQCNNCQNKYDNYLEYICPFCGKHNIVNLFTEIPIYIKFLIDISNRSASLIDRLKSHDVPYEDIRRLKLGAFNVITLATIFDLRDYDNDLRFNDSRIPKELLLNNPHLPHSAIEKIIETIDMRNYSAYLTMSLFQFENLFADLAKQLGYQGNYKYEDIVRYLIPKSNLENCEEKVNMLILPAIVRNALHNRGIYNKKDRTLQVKNIKFVFRRNTEIKIAAWRHLCFYFNNMVDVMEELLLVNKQPNF